MASERAPAFQFYPKDYESDEHVKLMSLEQEGAYLRLLCHSWLHGSIPSDTPSLAKICRVPPAKMARLWSGIRPCWKEAEDGRLQNGRQERDRAGQIARRELAAEKGKKGSESRWQKHSPGHTPGHRPARRQAMPTDSFPSPSPTSTATTDERIAPTTALSPAKPSWNREASDDWIAAKGGKPPDLIFGALKAAVTQHGWDRVRPVWQFYLASTPGEFLHVPKFVSAFGEWEKRSQGGQAPGAPRLRVGDATMAAAGRVLARYEAKKEQGK